MNELQQRIQLGHRETEHLAHYLHTLSADARRQPSACAGWEVRDVVAHLTGVAEAFTNLISRRVAGDASPPPGYPSTPATTPAAVADRIAQRTQAQRERLGDQLLTAFRARHEALTRLLTGLGADDWEKPCYHIAGPFPVRTFLDLRIVEQAIHGWDIRGGLNPSASLSPESLPIFLDVIPQLALKWVFRPSARLPTPVRYRFVLTGAVADERDIVVVGDTARMEPVLAQRSQT
jgi:uncharacterized protein (TIGR03083 family)